MAVYVACWISFGTRVLNNSMIQVHRELEEDAQVGGVSTLRILWKVILPLIRPGVVYVWIWTSLSAYRELTMAVVLASPKSQVLSTYIWGQWHGGGLGDAAAIAVRSEEHTSELQSLTNLVCRLLLEKQRPHNY